MSRLGENTWGFREDGGGSDCFVEKWGYLCWQDCYGWIGIRVSPFKFTIARFVSVEKIQSYANLCMLLVPDCYLRITGENRHYGTPTNPQMPSCIPGGSSSGSAVAVAAGLVDFALGIFSPLCFALQSHVDHYIVQVQFWWIKWVVLLAKVLFEFIAFKVYSFGVESVIYFTELCVCVYDTRFVLLTYL